jgi:predicted DNA-binding transcriptional regulator YafY
MDVRSVRRYITILQDVGIPVEATIGRHGGYRLRPGFKLPPLMFTEEEATAIMLGLLASTWIEVGMSSAAIEGALAKLSRVLPMRARERLDALAAHLILLPHHQSARPDATLLISLSEAIQQRQRIAIDYRSHLDQVSHRNVEPYGITGWKGHWYLVGYCCLRQAHRMFRLDRIQHMQQLPDRFERAEDFDYEAYIREQYTSRSARWQVEVEFQAALYTVQQKVPASFGTLTATPTGVLLAGEYDNIDSIARYLIALELPFVVRQPAELRAALRRLAEQIMQIATSGA